MAFEMNRGRGVSDSVRNVCRVLGPVCLLVAIVLMGMCIYGFFQWASQDPQEMASRIRETDSKGLLPIWPNFWMAFVAMPFLLVGGIMTNLGYIGVAGRYVARELAPAGKVIADAVLDGREIRLGPGSGSSQTCPKCATVNDMDAKFCKQCGEVLAATSICPACGKLGDADAQFCSHCGEAMQ